MNNVIKAPALVSIVKERDVLLLTSMSEYINRIKSDIDAMRKNLETEKLKLSSVLDDVYHKKLLANSDAIFKETQKRLTDLFEDISVKFAEVLMGILKKCGITEITEKNLLSMVYEQLSNLTKVEELTVYCNIAMQKQVIKLTSTLPQKINITVDNTLSVRMMKVDFGVYMMFFDIDKLQSSLKKLLQHAQF